MSSIYQRLGIDMFASRCLAILAVHGAGVLNPGSPFIGKNFCSQQPRVSEHFQLGDAGDVRFGFTDAI